MGMRAYVRRMALPPSRIIRSVIKETIEALTACPLFGTPIRSEAKEDGRPVGAFVPHLPDSIQI